MQTYDFSPFYRSTVGFDRLFNRLDGLVGQEAKTYPPYNIEKVGEDAYRISIAVAGFAESDLVIESKENSLVVKGAKAPTPRRSREFLHRGIAERAFELRFQLAEYVEVSGRQPRERPAPHRAEAPAAREQEGPHRLRSMARRPRPSSRSTNSGHERPVPTGSPR